MDYITFNYINPTFIWKIKIPVKTTACAIDNIHLILYFKITFIYLLQQY